MKTKNVLKPLCKRVLILLGLTVAQRFSKNRIWGLGVI